MERGAWGAIVHGIAKSQTHLRDQHFHFVFTLCIMPQTLKNRVLSYCSYRIFRVRFLSASVDHFFSSDSWKWSESESCSVVSDSLQPHGLYSPWNSPGQNIGVGSLSLLQGIFPTQGSNPALLHCRQILYQLSYEGYLTVFVWANSYFHEAYFNSVR